MFHEIFMKESVYAQNSPRKPLFLTIPEKFSQFSNVLPRIQQYVHNETTDLCFNSINKLNSHAEFLSCSHWRTKFRLQIIQILEGNKI